VPQLPPRVAAAVLLALVTTLGVLGLACSETAGSLLTPPPTALLVPIIALWMTSGAAVVFLMWPLPLPRLAQRLLVIASLAVCGWGLGNTGRALYVVLAFATADEVSRTTAEWTLLPGDGTHRTALSPDLKRTATVAVEAGGPAHGCVEVHIDRTDAGDARLVLPDVAVPVQDCGAAYE